MSGCLEGLDRGSLAYGVFLATCVYAMAAWVWYEYWPCGEDDGVRELVERKRSEGKSHFSNGV